MKFTSRERGNCRFTYSRRKVFWDKVSEMVRAGYTCHAAIDKIYDVYRNASVTTIINLMKDGTSASAHISDVINV